MKNTKTQTQNSMTNNQKIKKKQKYVKIDLLIAN